MKSLQGQFLIASPQLLDPNFVRTVILVVRHGEDGALGLIVNRPTETTLAQVCEQVLETSCEVEAVLYQGGPCEGPLMAVHTSEADADLEVASGVHFTTEREKIESLLTNPAAPARFFVGYAGWSAGQLEAEMETGSWLTAAADSALLFDPGTRLWHKLTARITLGQWIDPDRIPDDPTVN